MNLVDWYLSFSLGRFGRGLSLIFGGVLALGILIWPKLLYSANGQINHGILSTLMLCMSLLFVHGVGFKFKTRLIDLFVSPIPLWCLMCGILFLIV